MARTLVVRVEHVVGGGAGYRSRGEACVAPSYRVKEVRSNRARDPRVDMEHGFVGWQDFARSSAGGAQSQAPQSRSGVAGDLTHPEVIDTIRAMVRTESRITIASTVAQVWAYICDVGRWPEWAPTVLECRVRGGAPLQPGSRVEQRAKGLLWSTRARSQEVIAVEAPRYVAFAGPMGTSAARWGMELEPLEDRQTDAKMWIEVDLAGIMRAVPGRMLKGRIQRVSDREMAAIKAAVESAAPGCPDS